MRRTIDIGIRSAAILLLLAATACSSGDGGDGSGGDGGNGGTTGTRDIGFVMVDEVDDDSLTTVTVSGGGAFVRFDADVPEAYLSDPWGDLVGTCDVTTIALDDPFQDLPLPGDLDMTFLEAGAAVDVTADGAAYLELARQEATLNGDTFISYATSGEVTGPLAANLAVDIPGDEFPAVTDAALPDVEAFTLTTPADPGAAGSVGVDTSFEWSGTSVGAETIVTIDLVASDLTTFVTCYAADTGSFDLPAATKTELGAAFSGQVDSAGRRSIRVETVGDARLLLNVSRTQTFAPPIFIPLDEGSPHR